MHYLDYNATAPIRPEALEAMRELQAMPLNASSIHALGRKAKSVLHQARSVIAETIGVFPAEVTFTASGSEANNWVIRAFSDRAILAGATEHASILATAQRVASPLLIPVSSAGLIEMEALERMMTELEGNPFLVSVMLANNETGIIQPIDDIAALVHRYGGVLHTDAVQALGKITLDFNALGCDLMTVAAHKMGGAVGAAALIAKNTITFPPLLTGGGQENRQRAGTENIPAIAAFARAVECMDITAMQRLQGWRDAMEAQIIAEGGEIIGKDAPRLPNTSCILMPGVTAETQLIHCDLAHIAVSSGSACSSGRVEPSHVLKAMGVPAEQIATAVRVSSGWATREEEVHHFTASWKQLANRIMKSIPLT